jgi:hypothetical protein
MQPTAQYSRIVRLRASVGCLRALGTLPKVKIILGKYQERTVTCRAADCMRRLEYQVPEEKKPT